jgi:hypothetical protein
MDQVWSNANDKGVATSSDRESEKDQGAAAETEVAGGEKAGPPPSNAVADTDTVAAVGEEDLLGSPGGNSTFDPGIMAGLGLPGAWPAATLVLPAEGERVLQPRAIAAVPPRGEQSLHAGFLPKEVRSPEWCQYLALSMVAWGVIGLHRQPGHGKESRPRLKRRLPIG